MFAAASHCSLCCRTTASETASSRLRARSSLDLVGPDVVLEVDSGIERPIRLLRLVFEIDLRERQAHVLRLTLSAVSVLHGGDDYVVHLEDEKILLALAGLAMRDRRFPYVHARCARLHSPPRRPGHH